MGLACIAVTAFVLFLLAERVLLRCARKRFALVIHVNGTRGKSTVTRMIHALLRRRGMEVFAKTTGSAAYLLLPDGTEKPLRRLGPANIREQRNVMIMNGFRGKRQNRALVFECNAVQEELQYVSTKWLKPDITVITNVREDHTQELGTAEQAARIFAAAVPENSALVTSEGGFIDEWKAAARQKNVRLCYVDPLEAKDSVFPENTACVLGIADYLKIDRAQALLAAADYTPDTGAFAVYSWETKSRRFFFADARAANDIESTKRLSALALQMIKPDADMFRIFLLVNREDRPDRTDMFSRYIKNESEELYFDRYLCLGHAPLSFQKKLKQKGIDCSVIRNIKHFETALAKLPGKAVYLFAAGNFCGKGKLLARWLAEKRRNSDFKVLV